MSRTHPSSARDQVFVGGLEVDTEAARELVLSLQDSAAASSHGGENGGSPAGVADAAALVSNELTMLLRKARVQTSNLTPLAFGHSILPDASDAGPPRPCFWYRMALNGLISFCAGEPGPPRGLLP